MTIERRVRTGDGRLLAVTEDGAASGEALFMLYGTPAGRTLAPVQAEDAAARGIRLLSYDRPGYGKSTARAGRTVADASADVRAIADALGIDRFYVAGMSGGGPHALAAAALLPDRVRAAATLGGVAPFGAEGLDWLDGMGEENHAEFAATRAGRPALFRYLLPHRVGILSLPASSIGDEMRTLLSAVDREVLTDDFAEYLSASMKSALMFGLAGWLDDDLAFVAPWGFDLASLRVPVSVWHGAEDRFVPERHGRWLAAHVPGAEARILPGEGHLSLLARRSGEVHAWLAAHAR
ncbi:MAG TPA: alpha/beta fold hydrolase [Thermoplasmata archaeon]|nr:alpha/beta fold hydrolase [Thermoplasmata archaeon]